MMSGGDEIRLLIPGRRTVALSDSDPNYYGKKPIVERKEALEYNLPEEMRTIIGGADVEAHDNFELVVSRILAEIELLYNAGNDLTRSGDHRGANEKYLAYVAQLINRFALTPENIPSFQERLGKVYKDEIHAKLNAILRHQKHHLTNDVLSNMIATTFLLTMVGEDRVCTLREHMLMASGKMDGFSLVGDAPRDYLERQRDMLLACANPTGVGVYRAHKGNNRPPIVDVVYEQEVVRGTWTELDGNISYDTDFPTKKKTIFHRQQVPTEYFWNVIDGPQDAIFEDPRSAKTRFLVPRNFPYPMRLKLSAFDGVSWGHRVITLVPNEAGFVQRMNADSVELAYVINGRDMEKPKVVPGDNISVYLYFRGGDARSNPRLTDQNIDTVGACYMCNVEVFDGVPQTYEMCFPHGSLENISPGTHRMDIELPDSGMVQPGSCHFNGIRSNIFIEIEEMVTVSHFPFKVDVAVEGDDPIKVTDYGVQKDAFSNDEPIVFGATLHPGKHDASLVWGIGDKIYGPEGGLTRQCALSTTREKREEGTEVYRWSMPPMASFTDGTYRIQGDQQVMTVSAGGFTFRRSFDDLSYRLSGAGRTCRQDLEIITPFVEYNAGFNVAGRKQPDQPLLAAYRWMCADPKDEEIFTCPSSTPLTLTRRYGLGANDSITENLRTLHPTQSIEEGGRICILGITDALPKGVYDIDSDDFPVVRGCYRQDLAYRGEQLVTVSGEAVFQGLRQFIPNPSDRIASRERCTSGRRDDVPPGREDTNPKEGNIVGYTRGDLIGPADVLAAKGGIVSNVVSAGDALRFEVRVVADATDPRRLESFAKQYDHISFPEMLLLQDRSSTTRYALRNLRPSDTFTGRTRSGNVFTYWVEYDTPKDVFSGDFEVANLTVEIGDRTLKIAPSVRITGSGHDEVEMEVRKGEGSKGVGG